MVQLISENEMESAPHPPERQVSVAGDEAVIVYFCAGEEFRTLAITWIKTPPLLAAIAVPLPLTLAANGSELPMVGFATLN